MRSITHRILLVAALLSSATATSYDLPKRSLDDQVHSADVVSIGVVVSLSKHDSRDPAAYGIAKVNIIKALKGDPGAAIDVVYRNGISEQDLDCCAVGKTYFLVLRRTHSGLYESVNGRYGVLDIGLSNSSTRGAT